MGKQVIHVSSVTFAIKGRDLLRDNGIKAHIEKTADTPDKAGCGYSIHIPEKAEEAIELLEKADIKILGTEKIL